MIEISSDGMLAAVKAARRAVLARFLEPDHRTIGSINSPMQCMCKHVDPVTGEVSFVDFPHLCRRLR